MSLRTIIAFCAGAAVVFIGQRYLASSADGNGRDSARSRIVETRKALALLKSTPQEPVSRPTELSETTADKGNSSDSAPSSISPAANPDSVETQPQHTSTDRPAPDSYTGIPPVADNTANPPVSANPPGTPLPPVSPKVATEVSMLRGAGPEVSDSQRPGDIAPFRPSSLQTVVSSVQSMSGRLAGMLAEQAAAGRIVLSIAKPRLAEDTPATTSPAVEGPTVSLAPSVAAAAMPSSATGNPAVQPSADKSRSEDRSARSDGAARPQEQTGSPVASDAVSPEELEKLKTKIRRVLDHHRDRMLNTGEHGAWETMHSFIAYGIPKQLQVGNPGGKKVNAIGWICFNGPCAGESLFTVGSVGPRGRLGPGLQGHEGQFMAMLAQSRVEPTYPMKVDGRDYTVMDLVRQEQATCRSGSELTFKLIGLMHYLKSDETWKDDTGGEWGIPRLVKEELAQPIIGATCGGTHRLFGLTYAYKKRRQRGEPVKGQYRRAEVYVHDFQEYTFKMQNPDGSFSTAFFAGRGASPDPQRRLETTGHIAEWLTFSLEDNQLTQRRMVRAIDYLATLLDENQQTHWKVGPLGHALHALNMYDSFVLGGTAYPKPGAVAGSTQ